MLGFTVKSPFFMYSPFVISEFKTGLFTYLEPWISPRDSFSDSKNVFVNRGIILSREGLQPLSHRFFSIRAISSSSSFQLNVPKHLPNSLEIYSSSFLYKQDQNGNFYKDQGSENLSISLDDSNLLSITFPSQAKREFFISYTKLGTPIRAIIPFSDQDSETFGHLLVDDFGLCLYANGFRVPNLFVDQLAFLFQSNNKDFSFNIPWRYSLDSLSLVFNINDTVTILRYENGFTPTGPIQNISFNSITQTVSGTLKSTPSNKDFIRFSLFPDAIFPHNANQLISWDSSRNIIVLSNGLDRLLFFDISTQTLSKPFLPITENALLSSTNQIASAKQVKFYKNRLLLLDVVIENAQNQNGRWKQSIRWSAPFLDQLSIFSYWNFVSDKPFGGEYSPDTQSNVLACGEIRDQLVVWFSEDVYSLSFTGISQNPFVFNKINNSKYASCPFSATNLDTSTQIIGSRGYLQSDGNSVSRLDLSIPDFYKNIDFSNRNKIQSFRFSGEDNRICSIFPSFSSPSGECDSMLVYNFVENTFSEYSWSVPTISCLGLIHSEFVTLWGSMHNVPFHSAKKSFSQYYFNSSSRIPVAGGMFGEIYSIQGDSDWNIHSQSFQSINWNFRSCRLGPFIQQGLTSSFGFLDIYFEGFGENSPCNIILDIFSDGRLNPTKTIAFNLKAPKKVHSFHRIQLQVSAQFIELKFTRDASFDTSSPLKLLGLILWAEPGGDIRNIPRLL